MDMHHAGAREVRKEAVQVLVGDMQEIGICRSCSDDGHYFPVVSTSENLSGNIKKHHTIRKVTSIRWHVAPEH